MTETVNFPSGGCSHNGKSSNLSSLLLTLLSPFFPAGQASRSLLAAADLIESGEFDSVKFLHLSGGLNAWFKDDLEGEGEGESYSDKSGSVPFVPGYSVPQDAEELKD